MLRAILLVAFSVALAFGQPRPSFEVAAIHVSKEAPTAAIEITGNSVIAHSVIMQRLIKVAFGMGARFIEGPDWMKSEPAFDINATIPNGTPTRLAPEMLQRLLEERFKLKFHIEKQERNVYALVVAKGGAKMPASKGIDESKPGGAHAGIHTYSNVNGRPAWTSPNGSEYRVYVLPDGGTETRYLGATLPEFAFHANNLDGLDIIDMTGLSGRYDFTLTATALESCEPCKAPPPSPPLGAAKTPGYKESLAQMGLRLEKRKVKVDVFRVDSIEKTPTAN